MIALISGDWKCLAESHFNVIIAVVRIIISTEAVAHQFIQEVTRWEYEWNVQDHVNHARRINGEAAHSVVFHHWVSDYAVLNPLHGICCAVEDEHR